MSGSPKQHRGEWVLPGELQRVFACARLARLETLVQGELLDEFPPQRLVVVDDQDEIGRVHDSRDVRPAIGWSAERATDRRTAQGCRRMAIDPGATTAYGPSRK
jgi:hypothetical protein